MKALVFLILLNICLYASNREEELFNAIANRDISEVKQAIYKKVNISAKNQFGETPIMRAVLYGDREIVEFLLEKGADLNARDDSLDPVLIKSIYSHRLEITKRIAENTKNIDIRGKKKYTALMIAANHGDYPLVEYLLNKNANVNSKTFTEIML